MQIQLNINSNDGPLGVHRARLDYSNVSVKIAVSFFRVSEFGSGGRLFSRKVARLILHGVHNENDLSNI
jgi:hypothetical protein